MAHIPFPQFQQNRHRYRLFFRITSSSSSIVLLVLRILYHFSQDQTQRATGSEVEVLSLG
jgi:hypothetical protein